MAWELTVPKQMRVFEPTNERSSALSRTNIAVDEGRKVIVECIRLMNYSHSDRLAFQIRGGYQYLLVEEMSTEIRELVWVWLSALSELQAANKNFGQEKERRALDWAGKKLMDELEHHLLSVDLLSSYEDDVDVGALNRRPPKK